MIVIRNTYPQHDGVPHAQLGDVVEWRVARGKHSLVRLSDGRGVFGRDCYPKDVDDYRPTSGIVAQIKCRGWVLEIGTEA